MTTTDFTKTLHVANRGEGSNKPAQWIFFFCLFVLCDKVVFHAKLPEASKVTALFFFLPMQPNLIYEKSCLFRHEMHQIKV